MLKKNEEEKILATKIYNSILLQQFSDKKNGDQLFFVPINLNFVTMHVMTKNCTTNISLNSFLLYIKKNMLRKHKKGPYNFVIEHFYAMFFLEMSFG